MTVIVCILCLLIIGTETQILNLVQILVRCDGNVIEKINNYI